MQLDFAFVADFAQTSAGKINVIGGGFDKINAREVPLIYPLMSLVVRLQISPAEFGRSHQMEVLVLDEDGQKIATANGQIRVERPESSQAWRPGGATIALNFVNLEFKKFGTYAIEIMVNGMSLKSLALDIVPIGGTQVIKPKSIE